MLDEAVMDFLDSTYYRPIKKTTVKNLLSGENEYCLTNLYEKIYKNKKIGTSEIGDLIILSIKRYEHDKDSAIDIYKKFIVFLRIKKSIHIDLKFPGIEVSNTFERLMYIAKFFQDKEKNIEDLKDELLIGDRTIKRDLAKLTGQDGDPLSILGKVFKIDETIRENNTLKFSSTAHPLFLTGNLTQVLVMLKGLKLMSENEHYREYVLSMARDIWYQLSDYAKNRILYVCENLIIEGDLEWYKSLEVSQNDYLYLTEKNCSPKGCSVVLDCLKNGKKCKILYNQDGETILLNDCLISNYKGETVDITSVDKHLTLKLDQVMASAYVDEELISYFE